MEGIQTTHILASSSVIQALRWEHWLVARVQVHPNTQFAGGNSFIPWSVVIMPEFKHWIRRKAGRSGEERLIWAGPDPWTLDEDMTLDELKAEFGGAPGAAKAPSGGARGTKRARSQAPAAAVQPPVLAVPSSSSAAAAGAGGSSSKASRTLSRSTDGSKSGGGATRKTASPSPDAMQRVLSSLTYDHVGYDARKAVFQCFVREPGTNKPQEITAPTPFLAALSREIYLVEVVGKTPSTHPAEPWLLCNRVPLAHWVQPGRKANTFKWVGPRPEDVTDDCHEHNVLQQWKGSPAAAAAAGAEAAAAATVGSVGQLAAARAEGGRAAAQRAAELIADGTLERLQAEHQAFKAERAAEAAAAAEDAAALALAAKDPLVGDMSGLPNPSTNALQEDDTEWAQTRFPGVKWHRTAMCWRVSAKAPGKRTMTINASSACMAALLHDHQIACLWRMPPGSGRKKGDHPSIKWYYIDRDEYKHFLLQLPGQEPKWVGPDPEHMSRHTTDAWLHMTFSVTGVRGRQLHKRNQAAIEAATAEAAAASDHSKGSS